MMKRFFLVLSFIFLSTTVGLAQDIRFEATVNTTKVSLGSSLQLTLTIENGKTGNPVELPTIDGFEPRYVGPSTHVSIVNGQYASSVAYRYSLFALKVGKFQVPAITIDIDGKTYTSQSIDVEVVDAGSLPATQSQTQQGEEEPISAPASLEDKIFLTIETPRNDVYLGEKIPLTIKLFVSQLSVRDIQLPEFEHDGFLADEFVKPQQYTQVMGGIQYNVVEFNTFLYPTQTGDLNLGPAQAQCNILSRSSRARSSPFGDHGGDPFFDQFFGDDFFQGFFNEFEKHPVMLKSPDFLIHVKPLPEENKPQDFSGGVGEFDFKVLASPTDLKVGDPVTIKMAVTGEGNFKSVEMPVLRPSDDFKLYDPEIKEEDNQKTVEQVLIPKIEDFKEVPEISFSYFDPKQEKYVTLKQGPFAIHVERSKEQADFKVVDSTKQEPIVFKERLGQDILFIKETTGGFYPQNYRLYKDGRFLLFVFVSLGLFFGGMFFYQRTQRLKTDTVYARRLLAPKKAKKGMEECARFLKANQPKEFYDAVFRTLQGYLGDKFHVSSAGMTGDAIRSTLESKSVAKDIVDKTMLIVGECDMMRFASMSSSPEKMKECFKKMEEVIDSLERLKV